MSSKRIIGFAFITSLFVYSAAIAEYTVTFDQPEYIIHPGDTFAVEVLIDPVPSVGLYSMGVKVTYNGDKALVSSDSDIIVPDALNANGLGIPPADKSFGHGFAAAAGAVVVFEPYFESLLLTVYITDLTSPDDGFNTYTLDLEFYYSQPQTNFLDFDGSILDPIITFDSAIVNVTVPGDFNGDHRVDLIDFAKLSIHWLDMNCGDCAGVDLSDDGNVGLSDLFIFAQYWLETETM